jgi:hypothetical protein
MADDFEYECLKVLREEHKDDHNLIRLWIIKWSWSLAPVLEKRRIWIDKDGNEKTRKAVGLTIDDVNYIAEHHDMILGILQGDANE